MIDPSILLQGRNPQIETSLDAQTQAAQLRNLGNVGQIQQGQIAMQPGELQAQQLQIQQAQMQNQQMQQAMKDQAAMRQAYVDANGDPAQTRANAIKNGVSMNGLQAFDQQVTARQTALEKLKSDQLADHLSQTDQLHTLFAPIAGIADPAQQGQAWNDALRQSVNAKLMTPDEAAKHPYPGSADAVNLYVAQLSSDKAITANAAQMRAQAQATDAANNTTKTNLAVKADKLQELSHALSVNDPVAYAQAYGAASADPFVKANPDVLARYDAPAQFNPQTSPVKAQRAAMTEEQIAQADQAAANASEAKTRDTQTAAHQRVEEAQAAERIRIEQQNQRYAQQGGGSISDPEYMRGVVAGEIQVNPRDKNFAATMAAAKAIDPTFTSDRYANRAATTKDFVAGSNAKRIQSFNQLMTHVGELQGASDDLGWNPAQYGPGWLGKALSNDVVRYRDAADTAGAELATLLAQGQATQGEADRTISNLKSANPATRAAGIDEYVKLVGGRARAIAQTYSSGTGDKFPVLQYIDPDAIAVAQAHGVNLQAIADQQAPAWMKTKFGGAIQRQGAAAPAPSAVPPVAPVTSAAPAGSAVTKAVTPHVQALRDKYNY